MPQSQNRDIVISNELHKNLGAEACTAAEFLILLQELDASRGWVRLGYASLFDFCHLNLNLTRAEAYSRTRLARLAGEVPQVLSLLRSGDINLSALRILAPILTPQNALTVFAGIRGKTTREVEDYRNTFRVHEKPAARGVVRTMYSPVESEATAELISLNPTIPAAPIENKWPHNETSPQTNTSENTPCANTPENTPHMQKTIRMALTLNEELWEKYCRACNLSNHSSNGTDVAEMMEMLLDHYLKKHDAAAKQIQHGERHRGCVSASVGTDTATQQDVLMEQKEPSFVTASRVKGMRSAVASHSRLAISPRGEKAPHKGEPSRYIPKQIQREVRERDGNRCAYVDETTGKRCDCERGLQYDHIVPFARGGASNTSQNLRLLCAAHNRLAAEHVFGLEFVNQKMRAGR
jgi:5-methylcytosine-specific restriction endonuclease McrA